MYFSIGSLTLMAILAFVLLYNNRLKKRANDELALKNKEIQLQAHELKNLNITKDKLFSIISHDLRSPLASLRGLMDMHEVIGVGQSHGGGETGNAGADDVGGFLHQMIE